MEYHDTKIGKIIEKEFDSRMESAVISYIMDKGMENIKKITDEQIRQIEGNGLMTAEFLQSLVRCARQICNECEWIEIIEYIRLYLWCEPTVHNVYLYKNDFRGSSFIELLDNLDLEESEAGSEIKLFAVVDKDCLRGVIKMYKYIISYDGGQLRDSSDFEWGVFNSYSEAEEAANNAKEEYINDWDIEGSEYDPDDFCIEVVEV